MARKKKRRDDGPRPYRHKVVRYYDPDGNGCRKDTPGAVKSVEETDTFYADFWKGGKRTRVSLKTTDITVAWQRLRTEQRRRLDRELGIRDHLTDAAEVPLAKHLDDWIESVKAGGATARHLWALRHSLDTLAELAGWRTIADLDQDGCRRALARLIDPAEGLGRGSTPEKPRGLSRQTRNHFLRHARQFGRWAAGPGRRLREDPFAGVETIDVSTDRRHDRREPTDEEIATLFEYLERPDAAIRCRMTGCQRALGYRVALATGLRANELRTLSRESFDLAGGTVTVAASYSKRRRMDVQPLPAWLVEQLEAWFAAGGACWGDFPENWPGRLLVDDLAAAGVPYRLPCPAGHDLYFDFHSLRHWYCSRVANQAGISPRTLLALTRHSTVDLAMRVYAKAQGGDVRRHAGQVPEPGKQAAGEKADRERKKTPAEPAARPGAGREEGE